MGGKLLVIETVAVLMMGMSATAGAITNGQPDENRHPYVGLLVFDVDHAGMVVRWRCSGALIAPNVVLTAGHCTDGTKAARFWPNEKLQNPDGTFTIPDYPEGGGEAIEGRPYTHPNFGNAENPYGGGRGLPAFIYRDVGVVVLDKPIEMVRHAALPEPGFVDGLKNKTKVDFVGYGFQEQIMTYPGQPPGARWVGLRNRMYAPTELVSGAFVHSAEFVRLALNPGGGSGGLCFGDSGGPDILKNTDIILAVNSYVTNMNCAGVGYSARVDIPEVLEWIKGFLQ